MEEKIIIDSNEFDKVGVGIFTEFTVNGLDVISINFRTDKKFDEVLSILKGLTSNSEIKAVTDTNQQVYVGYTTIYGDISIRPNTDDTFDYFVKLQKSTAMDIAKQASADIAYIAAINGIEF